MEKKRDRKRKLVKGEKIELIEGGRAERAR